MISKELQNEMLMSYQSLVEYLLKKYGKAHYDYFLDDQNYEKSRSVSRTREGLLCHHIDELTISTLSDPEIARAHDFSHQRADRLVYCNYLEHLLLHLRIAKDRFMSSKEVLKEPGQFKQFLTHGIVMLTKDINTLYAEDGSEIAWQERCYKKIASSEADYIEMLQQYLLWIAAQYEGEKNQSYQIGMKLIARTLSDTIDGILEGMERELLEIL